MCVTNKPINRSILMKFRLELLNYLAHNSSHQNLLESLLQHRDAQKALQFSIKLEKDLESEFKYYFFPDQPINWHDPDVFFCLVSWQYRFYNLLCELLGNNSVSYNIHIL